MTTSSPTADVPGELPPLVDPSDKGGLRSLVRHRYILKLLVRRQLQARYQGTMLGFAWSYIQPAIRLLMYWAVVGGIIGLHEDVPNFGVHLFCGMVLVHFFTESFNGGTNSIFSNSALVKKMAMPRELFPLAAVLVSLWHTFPAMVLLGGLCLALGWSPDAVGLLAALLAIVIVALLGTALALMFSAANVFFRDFGKIVATLTSFTHFAVPMIYPYKMVEDRFGDIPIVVEGYLYNPLADAVLLMQRAFWAGTDPQMMNDLDRWFPENLIMIGCIAVGACALFLVFAQWVFDRLEYKIPERL